MGGLAVSRQLDSCCSWQPGVRAIGAVIALTLIACGGSTEETSAGQTPGVEEFASLGGCNRDGSSTDRAPVADFLDSTSQWLQVAPEAGTRDAIAELDRTSTSEISLPVQEINENGAVEPATERTVEMHGSLLEGVDWVLDNPGSTAYLGVAGPELGNQVLFALVVNDVGDIAFAGNCQRNALTTPLLAAVEEPANVIALIGHPGRDVAAMIEGPADPVEEAPVFLNPQDAPPELLAELTLISLKIGIPSDWQAPATLCTRIEAGWNDCMPLDGSIRSPFTVSAYVEDASELEFWLLDIDADVSAPSQLIGSIVVDSVAAFEYEPLAVMLSGRLSADGRSVDDPGVRPATSDEAEAPTPVPTVVSTTIVG